MYHPDESQILSCGSDRKIVYWDAVTCEAIREVEGSAGDITALAIDLDGTTFVSGGEDKLVRMWDYDESTTLAVGVGHSGGIEKVRLHPMAVLLVPHCRLSVSFNCFAHSSLRFSLQVTISPDQTMLVSVGKEGGVFLWNATVPGSGGAAY